MALISRDWLFANVLFYFSVTAPQISPAVLGFSTAENPNFMAPIPNITVAVGREATLECKVDNLSVFKVAWLRVDTQTILAIHSHVITKNHRIAVTHTEHRNWYLHIRDIRNSDKGWYMCQINTDPMKSQVGYLDVVVPPDILDYPTSTDMVVREGSNVSLQCAAAGSPEPTITWRRENGELMATSHEVEVSYFEGPVFNITKVNRLQMGPYLCIASNGVPPSVSKRIMLIIHFAPMIWIQNQLVGAVEGHQESLECHSEAFPKSINYWTKFDGRIISQGTKYEPTFVDNTYKVFMKLTIKNVSISDFGTYKCIAKNSLGETDGAIKLYRNQKTAIGRASHNAIHFETVSNLSNKKQSDSYDSSSGKSTTAENLEQVPASVATSFYTFQITLPIRSCFLKGYIPFILINIGLLDTHIW
ncbi:neurotrimin isoform X3 [Dendroctonus ponderosae]|nr:neurotrimin isoform X3 [Dendroctonus ponderosae]